MEVFCFFNAPAGHDRGSQPFLWLVVIDTHHLGVPLGTQHYGTGEYCVPKGTLNWWTVLQNQP